jgi:hypothetical protein
MRKKNILIYLMYQCFLFVMDQVKSCCCEIIKLIFFSLEVFLANIVCNIDGRSGHGRSVVTRAARFSFDQSYVDGKHSEKKDRFIRIHDRLFVAVKWFNFFKLLS